MLVPPCPGPMRSPNIVPRPHAIANGLCAPAPMRSLRNCRDAIANVGPGHGNRYILVNIVMLLMPCPYNTGQVKIFNNFCYVGRSPVST
ncbi:MAG: hypothetical protein AB4352_17925 [Hormoscilla sp.]